MSGRGAFFFRLVQTLNDQSGEIKDLATFYIQQRLLKRKANVMHSHFIEAIFHFNDYEVRKPENHLVIAANVNTHSQGHQTYNKFAISAREKKLFSMRGEANRQDRTKLYRFMLEHMSDEDR